MELTMIVLGLAIVYATVHACVVSFKELKKRTKYEKAILIIGWVCIGMVFLGVMFGQ